MPRYDPDEEAYTRRVHRFLDVGLPVFVVVMIGLALWGWWAS